MQIGTFARTTEQVIRGIEGYPDFLELRLDSNNEIEFSTVKATLSKAGIPCTLHLPSNPDWKPIDIGRDIDPYLKLSTMIEAELVTFHSPLSTLFYTDETIDEFLQAFPLAYDAAKESGVTLAVETFGHYPTELMLLFNEFTDLRLVVDIGHGQILANQNRAISHVESFSNYIEMVNVHDNNASEVFEKELSNRSLVDVSKEELREKAQLWDVHLPIGEGTIDFDPIFAKMKEYEYDGRFLMMCADPYRFEDEREKFLDLWLSA